MTKILTKEQVESLIHGTGQKLTMHQRLKIPTLGQVLESHEALRQQVEKLENQVGLSHD